MEVSGILSVGVLTGFLKEQVHPSSVAPACTEDMSPLEVLERAKFHSRCVKLKCTLNEEVRCPQLKHRLIFARSLNKTHHVVKKIGRRVSDNISPPI